MLDHKLRPLVDPYLEKIAGFLEQKHISPNTVTCTGAMIACFCFIAVANQFYTLALIFLIANRVADGLDGVLAHHIDTKKIKGKKGKTHLGSYLDTVFDMLFYGGFVLFYTLGRPDAAAAGALLLFSFIGTSTSFLAYAILAANGKKPKSTKHKNKGFHYEYGLMEGSETIIAFVLMCLFPRYFTEIATITAIACFITTGMRIKSAYCEYS